MLVLRVAQWLYPRLGPWEDWCFKIFKKMPPAQYVKYLNKVYGKYGVELKLAGPPPPLTPFVQSQPKGES